MPQMANITVKKADGTTNIVYNALTPAGGDGSPSFWRADSMGDAPFKRATLSMSTRWNGPKTARRAVITMVYPQIATINGVTQVVNRVMFETSVLVPVSMPDADVAEAVAQHSNLLVDMLIRSSIQAGFAPN